MQASANHSRLEELFKTKTTFGLIVSMAIPTIASQLIGVIYNYADSIYIGSLNHPEQVAAIALALPLMLLIYALANLWGIGGGSAVSRAIGQNNLQNGQRASAFAFFGAILTTLPLSIIAWAWGDGFIRLLGASDAVLPYARQYFLWFFIIGAAPSVCGMVMAHLARAEGYARQASAGLILGALLNVVLDPLFIFQFGFGMGVAGAALATFLSNMASILYFACIFWQNRRKTYLSFRPSDAIVQWPLAIEIISVGLPSALLMLFSAISNNVLNTLVASHGDRALAAVGIAKKLDVLPAHISVGITQGALPLLAYAYAAGRYEKLRDILFTTLKVAFISLFIVVGLMEVFARPMSMMFIRDDETVRYATSFIRILCLSVPLFGVSGAINAFYQAIKRPRTAFLLSLIRKGLLDIPLMFMFERLFFITNIIWVQPIMDLLTICISLHVVRRFWKNSHQPLKQP